MTIAIIDGRGSKPILIGAGAEVAGALAAEARDSKDAAAASASTASAAATAVVAAGAAVGTYASTTAGLAATSDGDYFYALVGTGAQKQLVLYSNDSGAAVRQTEVITARPGFYNFESNPLPRWQAALAAHRAGTSRAYIACIGDSTMRGVGSNPAPSSADINIVRRSWPTVMAQALSQMPGIKATADSVWCDGFFGMNDSSDIGDADPRVTWETGWQAHPSMFVAGGKSFHYPSSASGSGRINFDFTVGNADLETDTVDVHYVTFPGYGDIVLTTNNAAEFVASQSTNASAGVGKLTGTRSSFKDMEWTIQRSSFTTGVDLIIYGVETYNAADKPIGVWNMGASGSRASNWVDDNQPYSFINAIQALAPQLCLICLTINDWANNTSEATYKAQMQDIIDACVVKGDVILIVGVPSNTGTAPVDRQLAFAGFVRDLADTNALPVVDLSYRWVSQSAYADFGRYYDGLHPSNVGYADIGHLMAQVVANPGYFYG